MWEFCVWSLFCCAVLCVLFNVAIIPLGKRERERERERERWLLSGCSVAVIVCKEHDDPVLHLN